MRYRTLVSIPTVNAEPRGNIVTKNLRTENVTFLQTINLHFVSHMDWAKALKRSTKIVFICVKGEWFWIFGLKWQNSTLKLANIRPSEKHINECMYILYISQKCYLLHLTPLFSSIDVSRTHPGSFSCIIFCLQVAVMYSFLDPDIIPAGPTNQKSIYIK